MSKKYSQMHKISTNVRLETVKRRSVHGLLAALQRLSPKMARTILLRQFFTPRPFRMTPMHRDWLAQARPFHLQVNGQAVACWQWGRGPAILFAHGWNGRGIQFAPYIEAVVARGHSAIVFDAPGHGDSAGPTSSYFQFTDAIRRLLNTGQDIRGIISHSMGGAAAINALAKENLALAVVLIAPVLKLTELLANAFAFYGVPATVYQAAIADLEERFGYRLAADNPYALIDQIGARILIVHDMDDTTVPYPVSRRLAENHPHVSLVATRGLGHKRILSDAGVQRTALGHLAGRHPEQMAFRDNRGADASMAQAWS